VESNIVHDVESELDKAAGVIKKILPRDLPSDTREVAGLAEEAATTVEHLDPALTPLIDGLESAFKSGVDALNVLREKIDALKSHATVKSPVVEPAPVEPEPVVDPTDPPAAVNVPPTVASLPDPAPPIVDPTTVVPPTPVSDPTPVVASDPGSVTSGDVDLTGSVAALDTTAAGQLAAFKAMTPDEQAEFLAALENPTD
jgi:hypothetical protein